MEIATEVLFSVLPPALGNKTSIALTVTSLINLKTQQFLPPFDTSLYQF